MYDALLGRDGFRKGMDLYFDRHDGQAVTCDDFRFAMADATGKARHAEGDTWPWMPTTCQLLTLEALTSYRSSGAPPSPQQAESPATSGDPSLLLLLPSPPLLPLPSPPKASSRRTC